MKKKQLIFLIIIVAFSGFLLFNILKRKDIRKNNKKPDELLKEKFSFTKGDKKSGLKIEALSMEVDRKGWLLLKGGVVVEVYRGGKERRVLADTVRANTIFSEFFLKGKVRFYIGDVKIEGENFYFAPDVVLKSEGKVYFTSKKVKFLAENFYYDFRNQKIVFKRLNEVEVDFFYKCNIESLNYLRYLEFDRIVEAFNEKKNTLNCEEGEKVFSFRRSVSFLNSNLKLDSITFFVFSFEFQSPYEKLISSLQEGKGNFGKISFYIKDGFFFRAEGESFKGEFKDKKGNQYRFNSRKLEYDSEGNLKTVKLNGNVRIVLKGKRKIDIKRIFCDKAIFNIKKSKQDKYAIDSVKIEGDKSPVKVIFPGKTVVSKEIVMKDGMYYIYNNGKISIGKKLFLEAERFVVSENGDKIKGEGNSSGILKNRENITFSSQKLFINKEEIILEENPLLLFNGFSLFGEKLVLNRNSHNIKVYGGFMKGEEFYIRGEKIEKSNQLVQVKGDSEVKYKNILIKSEQVVVKFKNSKPESLKALRSVSIESLSGKGTSSKAIVSFRKEGITLEMIGNALYTTKEGETLKGDKLTLEIGNDKI